MKIAVFVKQVPDSAAKVTVDGGKISWGDAPLVINPWDEYAVEAALQLAEKHSGEVAAISMGGESAKEALKHALAMGAASATLINDSALAAADASASARVFASAVQKISGVDLVILGKQAIDTDSGLAAAMTARVLGWPSLTLVAKVSEFDPAAKKIKVEKSIEEGRQVIESKLPAVLSIIKDFGEPRYPSFMGIRKASKSEIPTWTLADLGISAPQSKVVWTEIIAPPKREVTSEIVTGAYADEIAAKLADKIMGEGVL